MRELGAAGDRVDAGQWLALAAADRCPRLEPSRTVHPTGGTVEVTVDLPMPAISLLELHPR